MDRSQCMGRASISRARLPANRADDLGCIPPPKTRRIQHLPHRIAAAIVRRGGCKKQRAVTRCPMPNSWGPAAAKIREAADDPDVPYDRTSCVATGGVPWKSPNARHATHTDRLRESVLGGDQRRASRHMHGVAELPTELC